jgi:hypothetical protein
VWNARAAPGTPPTLLLADYFGDGPPEAALTALDVRPGDFGMPASPYSAADVRQSHGYLVAALLADRFEPAGAGADSAGDLVAGTSAALTFRCVCSTSGPGSPARCPRTGWRSRSLPRPAGWC